MWKNIGGAIFDVVVVLTALVILFYLGAITHILPLSENALGRINEFTMTAAPLMLACGAWLASSLSFLGTLQGLAILSLICMFVVIIAVWQPANDDPARN
jgi:hypothetical protein